MEALTDLREYTRRRYELLYGRPNWQFPDISDLEKPTALWLWQDADLRRVSSIDQASGAALLDTEIGVCLYFQVFSRKLPVRQYIARALQIRSSLLPNSGKRKDAKPDTRGAWRVLLHWLVEAEDFPAWIAQVAEVREQTSHFEEIPVDAIVRSDGTWRDAAQSHGLPRLLFQVRSALKKRNSDDIEHWQSADLLVTETLSNLPDSFADPLEKQCAFEVLANLNRPGVVQPKAAMENAEPLDLLSLSVENFRNLNQLALDFRDAYSTVEATVVQGPNGSGKSSIFEALSIAVAQASSRYESYLVDKNRTLFGRSDDYAADYLPNLTTTERPVHLALNSEKIHRIQLAPDHEVHGRVQGLEGTFLSQEASRQFVRMSATDLGGEIASGLSIIANDAITFVDGQLGSAQDQLRAFNGKWGLRANIVKKETVISQISLRSVTDALPNVSELVTWLGTDVFSDILQGAECNKVAVRWRAWQEKIVTVASNVAKNLGAGTSAAAMSEQLTFANDLIESSSGIFRQFAERLSQLSPDDERKLEAWSNWLRQRIAAKGDSTAVATLQQQERDTNAALALLTEAGRLLSDRVRHFDGHEAFFSQWVRRYPNICPTCDTDVTNRGGIEAVIQAVSSVVRNELQKSRSDYAALRQTLQTISSQFASLGAAPAPIQADERSRLIEQLSWLMPEGSSLDTADGAQIDRLIAKIKHIRARPNLPSKISDPDGRARDLCAKIELVSKEHDRVSRLPEAWKQVHQELRRKLASVTAKHLPQTLEGLWLEISRNMMPAAWQEAGKLGFHTGTRRSPEASVVIHGINRTVLASHILNGAEIHNLGLAWFFTKYLTRGRFRYRFVVLDDPADTMDQPTFRDLCRFLETLLRLHRINGMPLSLVVLLHEDHRALDVARATSGVLYQLRWNHHSKTVDKPLRVYGEQITPPLPTSILEAG